MKKYLGQYWILTLLIIALAIYMARYWYKISVECMNATNNQPPIVLENPTGRPARSLVS